MTHDRLEEIFYSFLVSFSADPPALEACEVCRGWANLTSDPPVRDYVVFARLRSEARGRNLESFESDPGSRADGHLVVMEHALVTYHVETRGPTAAARLDRLRACFQSHKGPEFFEQFRDKLGGVGVAGAKIIADATKPDATTNYSERAAGEFTVSARFVARFDQDWTDRLDIDLRNA